jgi:hypothetical protein
MTPPAMTPALGPLVVDELEEDEVVLLIHWVLGHASQVDGYTNWQFESEGHVGHVRVVSKHCRQPFCLAQRAEKPSDEMCQPGHSMSR